MLLVSRSAPRPIAVDEVLRELGPSLRRGDRAGSPAALPRQTTGIPVLDRLLGGGVPRGGLGEITGAASTGRTSLAMALLARVTGSGELAALVDTADSFDPVSASQAGVVLPRVLWIRPPRLSQALRSAERVLEARGFSLVVLDIQTRLQRELALPPAAWPRLGRAAAASGTTLVTLAPRRLAGSQAGWVLELHGERARFSGTPLWLSALDTRAVLVRNRSGPPDGSALLRLCTPGSGWT